MRIESFAIKSLAVQNAVMGAAVCLVLLFLLRGVHRRSWRHVLLAGLWMGMLIWFFNSPFWGFSRVQFSPQAIRIEYGFLSVFKNEQLKGRPQWSLESGWQGFPRSRKLYWLEIENHRSMKIEEGKQNVLRSIGACLEGESADCLDG